MGKHHDSIKHLRNTGRGSDFYGVCDQCGKHVSETWVMQTKTLWKREDGTIYSSAEGGGAYGHRECLIRHFGEPNVFDTGRPL